MFYIHTDSSGKHWFHNEKYQTAEHIIRSPVSANPILTFCMFSPCIMGDVNEKTFKLQYKLQKSTVLSIWSMTMLSSLKIIMSRKSLWGEQKEQRLSWTLSLGPQEHGHPYVRIENLKPKAVRYKTIYYIDIHIICLIKWMANEIYLLQKIGEVASL